MANIYDGSFVLGSTSATTLSAGPGIKLDTSVPGVIGIGTDETVLWSGTQSLTGATSVNLSENVSSFNGFKFEWSPTYGNNRCTNVVDYYPNTNNIPIIFVNYWNTTAIANAPWEFLLAVSANGTELKYLYDYKQRLNGQASATNHHESILYKVIGLNRKQNGEN